MKSIIQDKEECYVCGITSGLHTHHCIHGNANRKIADKYGLTVRVCYRCHTRIHDKDRNLDLSLIKLAQRKFEETHSREEWMELFERNWLWDEK